MRLYDNCHRTSWIKLFNTGVWTTPPLYTPKHGFVALTLLLYKFKMCVKNSFIGTIKPFVPLQNVSGTCGENYTGQNLQWFLLYCIRLVFMRLHDNSVSQEKPNKVFNTGVWEMPPLYTPKHVIVALTLLLYNFRMWVKNSFIGIINLLFIYKMSLAPAEKTIVKNFKTFQNFRVGPWCNNTYLYPVVSNDKQLRTNSWTSDGFVIRFLGANFSIVQRQQFFIFPVFFSFC